MHKREDGKTVETFISEPYSLDEEGMRSLLKLVDAGWAVSVTGMRRYTIHVPGSQTTSKTTGGAFAGGHTHQFDPGPRLLPLDGFGQPAVVRVFAICARLN